MLGAGAAGGLNGGGPTGHRLFVGSAESPEQLLALAVAAATAAGPRRGLAASPGLSPFAAKVVLGGQDGATAALAGLALNPPSLGAAAAPLPPSAASSAAPVGLELELCVFALSSAWGDAAAGGAPLGREDDLVAGVWVLECRRASAGAGDAFALAHAWRTVILAGLAARLPEAAAALAAAAGGPVAGKGETTGGGGAAVTAGWLSGPRVPPPSDDDPTFNSLLRAKEQADGTSGKSQSEGRVLDNLDDEVF